MKHKVHVLVLIIALAVLLSLASLDYVRPQDCNRFCPEPASAACPSGACRSGEQRAGFPIPIRIDGGAGSSPTGGWGKLGPEDPLNLFTLILDVLVYSGLIWLGWQAARLIFQRSRT